MNKSSLGIKLDKLFIIDKSNGKTIASFNISAKLYTLLSKLKTPTLQKVKEKFEQAGIRFPFTDNILNRYYKPDSKDSYEFKLKRIR